MLAVGSGHDHHRATASHSLQAATDATRSPVPPTRPTLTGVSAGPRRVNAGAALKLRLHHVGGTRETSARLLANSAASRDKQRALSHTTRKRRRENFRKRGDAFPAGRGGWVGREKGAWPRAARLCLPGLPWKRAGLGPSGGRGAAEPREAVGLRCVTRGSSRGAQPVGERQNHHHHHPERGGGGEIALPPPTPTPRVQEGDRLTLWTRRATGIVH